MQTVFAIDTVAEIIRTAVTPVFLLVGVSGFLATMSMRLGRVIDRKRDVHVALDTEADEDCRARLRVEIERLDRRIRLVNWSIRSCVLSALVVCLVIVCLFLGDMLGLNLAVVIASLFMLVMLLLTSGLIAFLLEVGVATDQARDDSLR